MAYIALLLYTGTLFFRPQDWVPGLVGFPVVDVAIGLALVTWAGHLAVHRWRIKDAPQNWLMLGLYLAVLMSHVRHTYFAALVRDFQVFGKLVLIYFLVASVATSVKRVRAVILVMMAGCLFMAIHGILQIHTGVGFGGMKPTVSEGFVRAKAFGVFNDPNDLALVLVTAIPFLLSGALTRGRSLTVRIASCAALAPMLYCVYLTNSRGGWLALAVMLLAYLYLHLPYKKMALAMAVAVLPIVFYLGPERVQTISTDESSAHIRMILWGNGNQMLKRWPLFGAGYRRFNEFSERSLTAHNSFVLCYAELGLVGYFFWLGLIMATLKDGYAFGKLPRDGPEAEQYALLGKATVSGLVGFLAAAFFLTRTHIHPLYLLLSLVAALRAAYERDVGPLQGGFALKDSKYVVGAEMLSIPGMWLALRLLQ